MVLGPGKLFYLIVRFSGLFRCLLVFFWFSSALLLRVSPVCFCVGRVFMASLLLSVSGVGVSCVEVVLLPLVLLFLALA
jgi:hypothetical protein